MKWGNELPSLLEMADAGQIVPALASKPTLITRWTYTREVYETLRGSRRYTMGGAANIPFSEFASYVSYVNMDKAQALELWTDLKLMDDIWLVEQKARQDAKTGS